MAVRFLPATSGEQKVAQSDRANLAEVIELRSLLQDRVRKAPIEITESDCEVTPVVALVADAPADAEADAVRLLARRATSSGELREELLRLGHAVAEVETVIDEFEQNLYLDDAGLARLLTEKLRTTKRLSRSQIRLKLKERRLADCVIEAALGELDEEEELELLRSTAQERARRLNGIDRATAERRLLGFLSRRGWSGEAATRAAREALSGSDGVSSGVRFR